MIHLFLLSIPLTGAGAESKQILGAWLRRPLSSITSIESQTQLSGAEEGNTQDGYDYRVAMKSP